MANHDKWSYLPKLNELCFSFLSSSRRANKFLNFPPKFPIKPDKSRHATVFWNADWHRKVSRERISAKKMESDTFLIPQVTQGGNRPKVVSQMMSFMMLMRKHEELESCDCPDWSCARDCDVRFHFSHLMKSLSNASTNTLNDSRVFPQVVLGGEIQGIFLVDLISKSFLGGESLSDWKFPSTRDRSDAHKRLLVWVR